MTNSKQSGVRMAEVSREKIKKYHWFNRYVNADSREKSWTQFNFCENPRNRYVRVRTYNISKYLEKNVAVEIGNVNSTHAIARVKFHFYVRFYCLRTLTCVDKNATVEIHLISIVWTAKTELFENADVTTAMWLCHSPFSTTDPKWRTNCWLCYCACCHFGLLVWR